MFDADGVLGLIGEGEPTCQVGSRTSEVINPSPYVDIGLSTVRLPGGGDAHTHGCRRERAGWRDRPWPSAVVFAPIL
jgi:hypothetical protein